MTWLRVEALTDEQCLTLLGLADTTAFPHLVVHLRERLAALAEQQAGAMPAEPGAEAIEIVCREWAGHGDQWFDWDDPGAPVTAEERAEFRAAARQHLQKIYAVDRVGPPPEPPNGR